MEDGSGHDILVVTTTVATAEDGRRLAQALIEQRLAACVQLDLGITSLYRWEGRACEDAEVRLVIKTLPQHEPALQAWLLEQHPYQLPQYLAVRASASAAYAQWVRAQVAAPG
jgi:periplasmic divalent cation tolerance protein